MFRILCIATTCAIALTISAPTVRADDSTPRIDRRQENQKARIKEGVKSGELTRKEARNLARGQRRINRMEKDAAADGVITKKERRQLRRTQDRQSANIYRKKHNRRDRK